MLVKLLIVIHRIMVFTLIVWFSITSLLSFGTTWNQFQPLENFVFAMIMALIILIVLALDLFFNYMLREKSHDHSTMVFSRVLNGASIGVLLMAAICLFVTGLSLSSITSFIPIFSWVTSVAVFCYESISSEE